MKHIKLLFAALFLGGSIFLFIGQPASAASFSEAERLVEKAESWGGALKWAISIEYTGKVDYPNMNTFNHTKSALLEAQKAVAALPEGEQKRELENRLESKVNVYYTRAVAYIDAITSGKKYKVIKLRCMITSTSMKILRKPGILIILWARRSGSRRFCYIECMENQLETQFLRNLRIQQRFFSDQSFMM
ncbi:hypothetical protein [Bacillus sp. P14.5]|uniref:hypothetical protein n=1 Tax=Bacillus sp. P14.5 TaxID=1983400 RepID=UPI000DEB2FE5|nr:hypothetical protein [Bacillus sp. P14.5]